MELSFLRIAGGAGGGLDLFRLSNLILNLCLVPRFIGRIIGRIVGVGGGIGGGRQREPARASSCWNIHSHVCYMNVPTTTILFRFRYPYVRRVLLTLTFYCNLRHTEFPIVLVLTGSHT